MHILLNESKLTVSQPADNHTCICLKLLYPAIHVVMAQISSGQKEDRYVFTSSSSVITIQPRPLRC